MSKEVKTVHGFVVDHKESGVRYAVSPQNFNPKIHDKVRELESHETVRGFQPKRLPKATQTTPPAPSPEGSKNTTTK